jgi:hypothetical protein
MKSLNVGCGGKTWGDVRLDSSRKVKPTVIADAHFLPFRDDSFENTLSSHVLEHLNRPWQALDEIIRVTSKRIMLRFPVAESEYWLFFFNFPTAYLLRRTHSHKWIINPEMVISRLQRNGWLIQTNRKEGLPLLIFFEGGRKARLLRWFTKRSPATPIPWQCVIAASKEKQHALS